MREWQSLSHVKWECKYHVVIVPKYPSVSCMAESNEK
jgi:REP element-mobilizing transposase RayT